MKLRNRLFFTQNLGTRHDTLLIKYEQLVADPVAGFSSLCSFLGLPFDPAGVDKVHGESVGRGAQRAIAPDVYQACEGELARLDAAASLTLRGRAVAAAK